MKEKVDQLLIALGLKPTDENHKIVGAWTSKNFRVVHNMFELDPLLLGKDKEKQFEYAVTKACLDLGRFALIKFGNIVKEPAGLKNKMDIYKPQFVVWDMSEENHQEPPRIIS